MVKSNLVKIVVSIGLLSFCTAPLFGQAVFGVATSQPPAADIGLTELTGGVALTVVSGTTVEAPLTIEYSAPITNNSGEEIRLTGTGGLAGISLTAPTLDSASNSVIITVPAGGVAGNTISISGVRVALPGRSSLPVTATVKSLTTGGNAIFAGQETGPVIGQITAPFAIDQSGSDPLSFHNGEAIMPHSSFMMQEGSVTAFTDNVRLYGQTVPTRIRITPFPEIPKGVKVTLGGIAASIESGSSLRTLSGEPATVPRADGSTSIIYEFTSAPGSEWTVESFKFYTSIEVEPTAGSGTLTFQAAIVPIGIAVPDSEFPSTDIPRYLERDVPDEAELITGSSELVFPFVARQAGVYTGIAITNPLNYRVNVTLTAYDTNGAVIAGKGIKNPIELTMPRKGQIAQLATELFGPAFNASALGTIRAVGKTPVLVGFYLLGAEGGTQLDGATAEVDPIYGWVWPIVFHNTPAPYNSYEIFNPGASAAKAQLELFDSSGHSIAKASQNVEAGGTEIRTLGNVFSGVDLASFKGGYVKGTSNVPLVVHEVFGNALESNVLAGQVSIPKQTYYLAHFASGGGYDSEINFVNADRFFTAEIRLTAVDEDGAAFEIGGNPASILIQPGQQWTRTVADLFPDLGGSLTTGYIKVDVRPYLVGSFPTVPLLTGSIRFSSAGGYGSAALPLFIPPAGEFIFSHVAQAKGYYTGVALMNPNSDSVKLTLEVLDKDGILAGSYDGSVKPGEKISRLLYQFVPASLGQVGGYIRVRSDLPVIGFSLFGTDDGLSLSAIPPQNSTSALQ